MIRNPHENCGAFPAICQVCSIKVYRREEKKKKPHPVRTAVHLQQTVRPVQSILSTLAPFGCADKPAEKHG
jgi:hypothetical protein